MAKRGILLVGLILGIIFCGCERNVTTIKQFEQDTTTVSITETESQTVAKEYETIAHAEEQSELVATYIEDIVVPDCAEFGDYYIYEEKIFYSYDYATYYFFEEVSEYDVNHKTQICMYDMLNKTNEVIYTLDNGINRIGNLHYDGNNLIFTITNETEIIATKMYTMELIDKEPRELDLGVEISNAWELKFCNNYIFWLMQGKSAALRDVYRYDYNTGETVKIIEDLATFFYTLQPEDGVMTICEMVTDKDIEINTYDLDGKLLYSYPSKEIYEAFHKDNYIVWLVGKNICIRDIDKNQEIRTYYSSNYTLVKDYVIVIREDGLYSIKLGETQEKLIIKFDKDSRFVFKSNEMGVVYGQLSEQYNFNLYGKSKFIVIDIMEQ